MERLQKLIAAAGEYSRRAAEELIVAGRVTVNGEVVTTLGTKASPEDTIRIDGELLNLPKRFRYVMLHKPDGYVTTKSDPEGRPTIYDLLFEDDRTLHPVGRLDRDTLGLLLLTNDGELTYRLTHPRYEVTKTYQVWLKPWPKKPLLKALRHGVELDDGLAKPKSVRFADPQSLELVLSEGRNREVRRMMEALEHEVVMLQRIAMGPLTLGRLKPGKARPLKPEEVSRLRQAVGLE